MAGAGAAVVALGAIVSAIGQIKAGNAAKKRADFQSEVAKQQAQREREKASATEEDFRRKSSRRAAASRAAAAASGVDTGTGSSLLVQEDFAGEEELSALRIGQVGEDRGRRLEQEASLFKASGKSAKTASRFRAGGTLLSGAGSSFSTFKAGQK